MDIADHLRTALPRRHHRVVRRLQGAQRPVVRHRAGRDARHHRPQRRRQDHHDGRGHRQDPARRRRRLLRGGRLRPHQLDETQIAELGIGRKFQKPTVFEMHTVEDNLELALKNDRRVRADAVVAVVRRAANSASTRSSSTIRLTHAARARGRQPVARPEAVAGDRHAAGAGPEAAAGRRAGRRHDRRRDRADRRAAQARSTATAPWWWSSTTWPSCASSASRSPACTKARCWRKAPSTRCRENERVVEVYLGR